MKELEARSSKSTSPIINNFNDGQMGDPKKNVKECPLEERASCMISIYLPASSESVIYYEHLSFPRKAH